MKYQSSDYLVEYSYYINTISVLKSIPILLEEIKLLSLKKQSKTKQHLSLALVSHEVALEQSSG